MGNVTMIKPNDVVNGKGIRTSIFFSGCSFKCKGCFNQKIWNFDCGYKFTDDIYNNKIKPTINEHIDGISILGGEPLHYRNCVSVSALISNIKKDYKNKTIWLWTGYTFEKLIDLMNDKSNGHYALFINNILKNIDVLIDGQYIEELRNLKLKWRGSSNQRVIDVQKSLSSGSVVTLE